MTSTAENWLMQPDSLGTATLIVTVVLDSLCILVVAMRTWARIQSGLFAVDDGLMVVALCIFTTCCVFTCKGVYTGLGTIDERLQTWNIVETTKVSFHHPKQRSLCCGLLRCSDCLLV